MGKPNSSLRFECKACPFARCAPCWASFACYNLAALVFCGFRGPDLTYVQKYTAWPRGHLSTPCFAQFVWSGLYCIGVDQLNRGDVPCTEIDFIPLPILKE